MGMLVARRTALAHVSRISLPRHFPSLRFPAFATISSNIKPDIQLADPVEPGNQHFSVGADGQMYVDLSFASEPLGMPAKDGYGWPQIEFNEFVGPEDRYTICRKLGWGMTSSTWLARDHIENSYVAIKILSGHANDLVKGGLVWEHTALQQVTIPTLSQHCLRLLSSFELTGKGSAGSHLCFVTPLFGGDLKSLWVAHVGEERGKVFPLSLAKRILLHTLRGVAHSHSCGVVHTDLKADNIFFDCHMSSDDIDKLLDSDPPRHHAPEQSQDGIMHVAMSQPLPVPTVEDAMSRTFAIADFGSGAHIVDYITSKSLRPPEIIIGGPWNETIDIWTFGCLIFQLVVGRTLFNMQETKKLDLDETASHLYQMVCYTGEEFEPEQLKISSRAAQYFNLNCHFKSEPPIYNFPFENSLKDFDVLKEADVLDTARFIRRCLRLNPKDRPSATDLLSDPWFHGVE